MRVVVGTAVERLPVEPLPPPRPGHVVPRELKYEGVLIGIREDAEALGVPPLANHGEVGLAPLPRAGRTSRASAVRRTGRTTRTSSLPPGLTGLRQMTRSRSVVDERAEVAVEIRQEGAVVDPGSPLLNAGANGARLRLLVERRRQRPGRNVEQVGHPVPVGVHAVIQRGRRPDAGRGREDEQRHRPGRSPSAAAKGPYEYSQVPPCRGTWSSTRCRCRYGVSSRAGGSRPVTTCRPAKRFRRRRTGRSSPGSIASCVDRTTAAERGPRLEAYVSDRADRWRRPTSSRPSSSAIRPRHS